MAAFVLLTRMRGGRALVLLVDLPICIPQQNLPLRKGERFFEAKCVSSYAFGEASGKVLGPTRTIEHQCKPAEIKETKQQKAREVPTVASVKLLEIKMLSALQCLMGQRNCTTTSVASVWVW